MLAAYTYRRNYPFEGGRLEQVTAGGPQPEHRILEELKVKHKLTGLTGKPIKFSHRFRLEQRFEGTSTEGIGTTSWDFAERARYRLAIEIPFPWPEDGYRPDYVSLYNEVFANFGPHGGSHTLDQNRTYCAVGWNLNKNLQLEIGYQYQYMPTPNGVIGERNHALQLTINSIAPFRRGLSQEE